MTYSKMPLRGTPQEWPKNFGFEIIGQGPCFVLHVEKNSVAYESGLQPGDQLLELDNHDVTNLSCEEVKDLARQSRTQPPAIGVVSRLMHVDVVGIKPMGLGFMVQEGYPVVVSAVEEGGPAQAVGLRPGDIIIEANGKSVRHVGDIKQFLPIHNRTVPMSFIALGKPTAKTQLTRVLKQDHDRSPGSEGSRVKRAKSLHDQMNEILGEDYEKKMAVVGVLKQYAEDRDIDMLARALSVILKTAQHRSLLLQIRQFIPPRQRIRFDDISRQQQQYMSKITAASKSVEGSPRIAHKLGQRRALQIVRENGSFGFVVKGSNPAYIETVDSKGAAEKAGLQPGDFIVKLNGIDVRKCSHSHLVQMLQDSGTSPTLEVLRCEHDQYPVDSSRELSTSSVSSTSSHGESDWLTQGNKRIVDKEGRSYPERAEYLLTKKERYHIRKAWIGYETTSNVVDLYTAVSVVLDTPSKKTLWMFLIASLTPPHQIYCINQINLPRHVLLECISNEGSPRSQNQHMQSDKYPASSAQEAGRRGFKISSFQQQVEFLLTLRERTVLKKSLKIYSDSRDVERLVEDLSVILDSPSKRTLWMYIVPLLTLPHQQAVRTRLGHQPSDTSSTTSNQDHSRINPTRHHQTTYTSTSEDEHEHHLNNGDRKFVTKHSNGGGVDSSLKRELEETRRAIQEVREFLARGKDNDMDHTKYITVIPVDQQLRLGSLPAPMGVQLPGQTFPMYHANFSQHFPSAYNIYAPSPPQRFPASFNQPDSIFGPFAHSENKPKDDSWNHVPFASNSVSNMANEAMAGRMKSPPSFLISGPEDNENRLKIPANFMTSGTESDNESESTKQKTLSSKFSKMGGGTFNRHALTALKQLDAAMAAEVSDLDHSVDHEVVDRQLLSMATGESTSTAPPPPPPPPPPAAPPLPMSMEGPDGKAGTQMNVKRINWEKLDHQRVENTVWEQIGEAADLQDVVRYLELEQYFSTKTGKSKITEKKYEVCILNPKKAYNISILLGHLKLSLGEVRQALYLMDEAILTPELLRQLLAYAPNKNEMEQLDSYTGDIEELSNADRFTYEMSRVPGYEQRLKALVFKGNFQEKITEMKEHLHCIRKASLELRHSKKLSKILELILAMGNFLNQGNQRVGEAAGFKIRFLSQLEITKTVDNKLTFLHVLAEAVFSKLPDLVAVGEELTTVPQAAKFSDVLLNQELQDLRKVLQDISVTLEKFGSQKTSLGINDKFQDVMGHFISQASDEIQGLFRLNASTMEAFQASVQYFGEDPKKVTTTELFGVFADFVTKFEKAHRYNMMYKRHGDKL
ncbi:delphilin-like [Dreissena polymorpha]|uniref:delphilin-like n=1 Tax=Dreissena polymorpha TaxID=45954 RepID=UPI00226497C7|nr:delphilin-like [Dreissena polymorpha]